MAGIKQISRATVAPKTTKKTRKPRVRNQDRWLLKHLDTNLQYTKKWTIKDVFYPSMLGNLCDRYLYLAYNGKLPDQSINAKTARIFDTGNSLEERMKKVDEMQADALRENAEVELLKKHPDFVDIKIY